MACGVRESVPPLRGHSPVKVRHVVAAVPRFDDAPDLLVGCLLDGGTEAIAGVVYDDVERAEGLERLVDDTTHSLGVGDIELGGPEPVAVLGVEVVENLGSAERGGDTIATGHEVFGEQSPEA